MKPILCFFVPGEALPKGSPEILFNRKTKRPFVREKQELYIWQQAVAMLAEVAMKRDGPRELIDDPVAIEMVYHLPRIKTAPKNACRIKLAAVKPDVDKLERAMLDALQGIIYTQDSRVTSVCHKKRAAPHGEPDAVGVNIRIGYDTIE